VKIRLSFPTIEGAFLGKILKQIVEVCVFRTCETETQFLILQRAQEDRIYPGMWQIVTGTMKNKENSLRAAMRELREETGLSPIRCWTVPYIDAYFDRAKDAVQMAPVFAVEVDRSSSPRMSSEHQQFEWLKFEEAKKRLVWPGQKHALEIVHEFIIGNKETARLVEIVPFSL
jgi:dATP pyrophosphohydrolase